MAPEQGDPRQTLEIPRTGGMKHVGKPKELEQIVVTVCLPRLVTAFVCVCIKSIDILFAKICFKKPQG